MRDRNLDFYVDKTNTFLVNVTWYIAFSMIFVFMIPYPFMTEIILLTYLVIVFFNIGNYKRKISRFARTVGTVIFASYFHYKGYYWTYMDNYLGNWKNWVNWVFFYPEALPLTEDAIMRNFIMIPYFIIVSFLTFDIILFSLITNILKIFVAILLFPFSTAFGWKLLYDLTGYPAFLKSHRFAKSMIVGWSEVFSIATQPISDIDEELDCGKTTTLLKLSDKTPNEFAYMSDEEFREEILELIEHICKKDMDKILKLLDNKDRFTVLTTKVREKNV